MSSMARIAPERDGFSPESEFSRALRLERSSSSLFRIDFHLTEKTLTEWEREITEVISSVARRKQISPVDDSGEFWSGFDSLWILSSSPILVFSFLETKPFLDEMGKIFRRGGY